MVNVLAGPALEQFRRDDLAGGALLARLASCGGKMLVSVSLVVGKSTALDDVTEKAVRSDQYDLVIVLCPTRRTLKERRWVKHTPPDVKVCVLKPRPSKRCGAALDTDWRVYEKNGLSLLGRAELCAGCPRRKGCTWPRQYGAGL